MPCEVKIYQFPLQSASISIAEGIALDLVDVHVTFLPLVSLVEADWGAS